MHFIPGKINKTKMTLNSPHDLTTSWKQLNVCTLDFQLQPSFHLLEIFLAAIISLL